MHPFSTTFRRQTRAHIRRSCPICWVIALLLLGILCSAHSLLAGVSNYFPQRPRIAAAHFAIADFDGDQLPDLATVRAERTSQPFSSYSIHLHFSGSPDAALNLIAPCGGLEIVARDVNGDAFTDLVVITATDSRLVAVLMNDGHGKFTVAKPAEFPGLAQQSNSFLFPPNTFAANQSPLPPTRGNFGAEALDAGSYRLPTKEDRLLPAAPFPVSLIFLRSRFGRSPPSASIPS